MSRLSAWLFRCVGSYLMLLGIWSAFNGGQSGMGCIACGWLCWQQGDKVKP